MWHPGVHRINCIVLPSTKQAKYLQSRDMVNAIQNLHQADRTGQPASRPELDLVDTRGPLVDCMAFK